MSDIDNAGVPEQVHHPAHYGGDTTYEVIKVLEAWGLDQSFNLGNAIKYIARAGKKGGASVETDLAKAEWYLNREVENLCKLGTIDETLNRALAALRDEITRRKNQAFDQPHHGHTRT